jgi:NADH-quinone oxidoreductase subunit N
MLSLLGFPPILGFFGKVPLFTSALGAGHVTLVVILAINSAIAAYYYLRVVAAAMLEAPTDAPVRDADVPSRLAGALLSAGGVVVLAFLGNTLMSASEKAAEHRVFADVETAPGAAPVDDGDADAGADSDSLSLREQE